MPSVEKSIIHKVNSSADRRQQVKLIDMAVALAFVAIALAVVELCIRSGAVIAGADFSVPLVHPGQTFVSIFSGWSANGGSQGIASFSLSSGGLLAQEVPYLGLLAVGHIAGLTVSEAERGVFALIIACPGIGAWAFLRRYPLGRSARFVASLMYMLNPYVMIMWHDGEAVELIAYGVAPFVLLLVNVGLTDERLPGWYWPAWGGVSIALAAPSSNPPTIVGAIGIPVVVVGMHGWRNRSILLGKAAVRAAGAIGVFTTVNAWWIIPTAVGILDGNLLQGFSHTVESQQPPDLTSHVRFVDAVLNFGQWSWRQGYQGQKYYPYEPDYHTWGMWVIAAVPVVLAGAGALALINSAYRRRYAAVGSPGLNLWIIGFLLAFGFHGPTGALYSWAYRHIPGFIAFRSPWDKFEPVAVLGVAMLCGAAFDAIVRSAVGGVRGKMRTVGGHDVLQGIGTVGVCGATVALVFPMFGVAGGMFVPIEKVHVPGYVTSVIRSVDSHRNCGVFIPESGWSSYIALDWYKGGLATFDGLFKCNVLQADSPATTIGRQWASFLDRAIEENANPAAVAGVMRSLGITDVIVASDYDFAEYGIGPTVSELHRYFSRSGIFVGRTIGQWTDYRVPGGKRYEQAYVAGSVTWTPSISSLLGAVTSPLNSLAKAGILGGAQNVLVSGKRNNVRRVASIALSRVRVGSSGCVACVESWVGLNGSGGDKRVEVQTARAKWESVPLDLYSQGGVHCPTTDVVLPRGSGNPSASTSQLSGGVRGIRITSMNALGACIVTTDIPVVSSWLNVTFEYRWLSGGTGGIAVTPNGRDVLGGVQHLRRTRVWTNENIVVAGAPLGVPEEVFVYSSGGSQGVGVMEYRDLSVGELAPIPGMIGTEFVPSHAKGERTGGAITMRRGITYLDVSGTAVVVSGTAFDPGWKLGLTSRQRATASPKVQHVKVDGYLNGWIVKGSGRYKMSMMYEPARDIDVGVGIAIMGAGSLCLVGWRSRRRGVSRKESEGAAG